MKEEANNIFTIYDEILQKKDKEKLLVQNAICIWMTGLSGSGKTTIAKILEKKLHNSGFLTQLLDGDNVRHGLNSNLSFSEADRMENIRRIAEVNRLFVHCGIVTINCFVSPTLEMREMARDIVGIEHFVEVFVDTPLSVCESRDVKGLYKKARAGEIKDFTGISSPFEAPVNADVILKTENQTPVQSVDVLLNFILPIIKLN